MPKWKRILITFGAAVIVVGIYMSFFGVQTVGALMVRYQYRKTPEMNKTPAHLTDLSISAVPHKKVSYFGYEFELPSDDVDDQKSKTTGAIRVTTFQSGNALWFSAFPPKSFVNTIVKDLTLDARQLKQLCGEEAFESDYVFHREILGATPSDITPFISRSRAVSGMTLLLLKMMSMPKADSGIFTIRAPGFEGFQFESPKGRPFKIVDELYSPDEGIDVIFFQKGGGSAPDISQPEINRVIQSIHRVTNSSATPAPLN